MYDSIIILSLLFSLSLQACHNNCKECLEYSSDDQNMKCISCKKGFSLLLGTQNCVDKMQYPSYFKFLDYLFPCDLLSDSCYECEASIENYVNEACLTCIPGYKLNEQTKTCETCEIDEYPIIIENFDSCMNAYNQNCELYITNCIWLKKEEHKRICEKNYFYYNNGTCMITNKNNEILLINWLKDGSNVIDYPSYNNDKSDFLLIELTINSLKRKLFFYNEEGRGSFDEIKDKYEIYSEQRRAYMRSISSSIALKLNNSEKYSHLLNFENYNNNLELIDIKTGNTFIDNLFNFLWEFDYGFLELPEKPTTQLLELNENNQFLLATFATIRKNNTIILFYFIFSFDDAVNQEISIDSLHKLDEHILSFNDSSFNTFARFYFIQTKRGDLYLSFVSESNDLYYYDIQNDNRYFILTLNNKISFQKLLLIKEEIKFLIYYSYDKYIVFSIFETINNNILTTKFRKYLPYQDNNDYADVIFLSEVKAALVLERDNSFTIFIINFFNDYKYYVKNEFLINLYGKGINNFNIYSLVFKYRNMLGLHIKNKEENGFVLFGYYNSTDPKQILDIKKEGLNHKIILGNYLNLQSNIFGYEIKCIRIIEVPDTNTSGIYLFSNITKNYIQKNDCIDINTEISFYFAYNGTIKKDNYLFKFVGVLQEPKFEVVQEISEQTFWNLRSTVLKEEYIEEYNKRRNFNITGRVALVQINVLNNIKVFCDKKYDEFALRTKEGELIACGQGTFYNVENMNEITQLNLGINYYFDNIKNCYIKCHQKCKTCSREFNDTNMNCDLCLDNYFIEDDNCFEISECEYNYYYEEDLNLKCISRDNHCPDFKPYENAITKECIENCSINEFNNKCNPTNNINSIMDTYQKIFDNINYLNLEEKLFYNKTKYTIYGNNVTFIFSTSEIEKDELYNNHNYSSIILGESEKNIRQFYSLNDQLPIPILKIETINNHSNDSELFYEIYNPQNLTQKLDLSLLPENYIEIRKPKTLKSYKMDLILRTRELGYDIFDLNSSFFYDICSVFSYNNTDFSLSERKSLIDLSDENLCLNDCIYSNYDVKTLRTICSCKIGNNDNKNITNNKNEETNNDDINLVNLLKDNMDFSKSSNIKVVKCFSIIFRKNLFIENYGFYIMFLLLAINITTLICSPISSIKKSFNEYCNEILSQMKEIYIFKNNKELDNKNLKENKDNNINNDNKDKKSEKTNLKFKKKILTENASKNISNYIKPIEISTGIKKINQNIKNKKTKTPHIKNRVKIIPNIDLNRTIDSKNEKSIRSFINNKKNKFIDTQSDEEIKEEQELVKKLKEKNNSDFYIYYVIKNIKGEKRKTYLSEYEMEGLSYENAIEIEDRNKSNYYFALLKEKNKIISMFLNDKDYNIQSIKISTFIFDFGLSLTINALFYDDEAIHQINQENNGDYSLSSQYSRVIYSAIISGFINFIVELLAFSQKKIIGLRNYKEIKEVEEEIPKLIKELKYKTIIYYVITIVLDIVFFYYITAFCAIYTIIQTHMISASAISFLLTMSYTLILSLISSIIRIFSLQKKNKLRHFLFIISWIISLI